MNDVVTRDWTSSQPLSGWSTARFHKQPRPYPGDRPFIWYGRGAVQVFNSDAEMRAKHLELQQSKAIVKS